MAESGSGAPAPTDRDIVIIREFDAPRPLVWDAWTRPEHLARWWGPRVFTNPVCELDVR
ncbi:MAG: SRPBCC domain-containing protein, partial [Gemmatimonadota bacterium]|nr:SRPBCC domain-containing protein [Gemmatimonadota bacterium]